MILRMRSLQSKAWRLVQASLELLGKIDIEQTLITLFNKAGHGQIKNKDRTEKNEELAHIVRLLALPEGSP